jgi:hypothetical protein
MCTSLSRKVQHLCNRLPNSTFNDYDRIGGPSHLDPRSSGCILIFGLLRPVTFGDRHLLIDLFLVFMFSILQNTYTHGEGQAKLLTPTAAKGDAVEPVFLVFDVTICAGWHNIHHERVVCIHAHTCRECAGDASRKKIQMPQRGLGLHLIGIYNSSPDSHGRLLASANGFCI